MTAPSAPEAPGVTAARIEVERRRGAMLDTVHVLQARLAPRTLASDAWSKAKDKGADLAEDAVDAVRARPVAIGGAAAAVALFLAREPITDAAIKLYDALTSRRAPKKRVVPTPARPAAATRKTAPTSKTAPTRKTANAKPTTPRKPRSKRAAPKTEKIR